MNGKIKVEVKNNFFKCLEKGVIYPYNKLAEMRNNTCTRCGKCEPPRIVIKKGMLVLED